MVMGKALLRIGFDGSRAFLKEKTGTENYSFQLLKHLALIDQKNEYLVYLAPGCQVQKSEWPQNYKFKTINYKRLWTQVGLSIQTFIDKLDILFVPAHTLPLIRKPRLKTLMTVHDLGAEYLPQMHKLKQRLYLNWITSFQLKTATKLIAVSDATKKDLIDKVGIYEKKIEIIYEGVDQNFFHKTKGDILSNILKSYDIEEGKYFLFVGTIQPRKNLVNLIKAFKGFLNLTSVSSSRKRGSGDMDPPFQGDDEVKLVLAGDKGWLSEDIFTLPTKLGIESYVIFLGRVPDKDLPSLYSGAKAFVYPSLYEGFGLPILEAMSCGCPVITSNRSSLPEVVGHAGILVDPNKIDQILEAFVRVAENKDLRHNLVKSGYSQVQKFSWDQAARETLKLFEKL